MKRLLIAALASILSFSAQAAETYTLDPSHTNIVWQVSHFGFSNPVGKFGAVEGTVAVFDPGASTSRNVRVRGVTVPDWSVVAATAVLPCWRLVRRARAVRPREPGLCPACGYDVRATPERCPECGHVQVRTATVDGT